MRVARRISHVVMFTVLVLDPLHAQDPLEYSDRAEFLFSTGLQFFKERKYLEAAEVFGRVAEEMSLNQRTTAAFVMKGKSQLWYGDLRGAEVTLRAFTTVYTGSSYIADAEFTLGLVYLRMGMAERATRLFLEAWRNLSSPSQARLLQQIHYGIDRSIEHLSIPHSYLLLRESSNAQERAYLWLKIGEKEASAGNRRAAQTAIDTLAIFYPNHPYQRHLSELITRVDRHRGVKLGVLLPLMRGGEDSPGKGIGSDIHDGILFAFEEYSNAHNPQTAIVLETRDTGRDPLAAARAAQELTEQLDLIGIIGPVFSNTASAAVGIANIRGVPLITPTANQNGIAATGPYVFQANPDFDTRGRAMAQYAIRNLGYTTLAVLAPIDTYGKFMAEAFIAEAGRLGARVIITEWYQQGAADLKPQLSNIRKAGFHETVDPYLSFGGRLTPRDITRLAQFGIPLRTLDSLIERRSIISATSLLGPGAKAKLDSLGIPGLSSHARVDSLEYPVTSIDGIYVPISAPEEIGVVSSQLVYFNIDAQILGSGEWNSFAELNANRRYCDGVIFDSDFFVDSGDPAHTEFVSRFYERFRKRPTKHTLYGYDVAKLVFDLVSQGATTRELLRNALNNVHAFPGLRSRIGLSTNRVNTWLYILQYSSNAINRIYEMNIDQTIAREYEGESRN